MATLRPPPVEGVVVVDREGRVLYANITGGVNGRSVGAGGIDALIPDADRSAFRTALLEAVASGEPRLLSVPSSARCAALSVQITPTPGASATILIGAADGSGGRDDMTRSTREARALCEVALEVNESLVPDRVFDLVVRHAATLLGARAARIVLLDGASIEVRASYGGVRAGVGTRVPVASTLSGEAIRTRRPVRTSDLRAELVRWPSAIIPFEDDRANGMSVPLMLGGEPFGAVVVFGKSSDFDERDETFLVAMASHAVNAIENSRLFAAQQRERELAECAATIARAALDSMSAAEAGRRILLELERLLHVPGLGLGLIEDQGVTLHYIAAVGNAARLTDLRVPLDISVTRGRFEEGRPVVVPSFRAATHESYRERVPEGGGIIVPLHAKGRLIGTLGAADFADRPLSPEIVDVLIRIAPTVALAIDVLLLNEVQGRQHERERMLASALATLATPVLVLDPQARITYANPAAQREYGFDAEEFAARSFWDLRADRDRPVPPEVVDAHLATHGVWNGEVVHRRTDGTCFPASVSHTLIRNESGAAVGRVIRAIDLTEALQTEAERRQTEKMAALGALVAGVAHELNNPLTGISAFAQLLLEDAMPEEQLDSIRLIRREADRAGAVIRDLLLFSRKSQERRTLVRLNDTIDLTLRRRTHGFRAAGIDVETVLDQELPLIEADDAKLQQVLLNLLVNAEQAMEKSAFRRLTIRTGRAGESVFLEVADTGAGMPAEVQAHIFEPFYTTKPAGSGTGLGLSVSYGIIQSHGGTCAVQSSPGEGTTFRITLPVALPTTGSHA